MAEPVGQEGVAGAEAAVLDHLPRRRVDGLTLDARPGRVERRRLGLAHEVPDRRCRSVGGAPKTAVRVTSLE